MATTPLEKAGYFLLLLLLTGVWAIALAFLIEFLLDLHQLVVFFADLTQLG